MAFEFLKNLILGGSSFNDIVQSGGNGLIDRSSTGASGWGWPSSAWASQPPSTTTSPAISALALLGFLFFLNMIQNSLNLNRQLLSTTVITTGTGGSARARNSPSAIIGLPSIEHSTPSPNYFQMPRGRTPAKNQATIHPKRPFLRKRPLKRKVATVAPPVLPILQALPPAFSSVNSSDREL